MNGCQKGKKRDVKSRRRNSLGQVVCVCVHKSTRDGLILVLVTCWRASVFFRVLVDLIDES